jgi:hypothetical protein
MNFEDIEVLTQNYLNTVKSHFNKTVDLKGSRGANPLLYVDRKKESKASKYGDILLFLLWFLGYVVGVENIQKYPCFFG